MQFYHVTKRRDTSDKPTSEKAEQSILSVFTVVYNSFHCNDYVEAYIDQCGHN